MTPSSTSSAAPSRVRAHVGTAIGALGTRQPRPHADLAGIAAGSLALTRHECDAGRKLVDGRAGHRQPPVPERRDPARRAFRCAAPEPHRDALVVQRRRPAPHVGERHGGRCERRGSVPPEHLAGGHGVVEALLPIRPSDTARPELLTLPPRPDAEVEAPAGEHVEGRRGLRQQHGRPEGSDQDSGAEPDLRRDAGHGGEHHQGLGPGLLGRIREGAERIAVGAATHDDVVGQDDLMQPRIVGGAREIEHAAKVGAVDAAQARERE